MSHTPGPWKVHHGDDDKVNQEGSGGRAMNVNEAMAIFEKHVCCPEIDDWYEEVKPAISTLTAEVERLRKEVAKLQAQLDVATRVFRLLNQ